MTLGLRPDAAGQGDRFRRGTRASARIADRARWRAWIILAISLLATAVLWWMSREQVREQAQLRFDLQADRLSARIVARMRIYEQLLLSGVAVFETWGDVSRDQFRSYAAAHDLDRIYPGLQGIGFAEIVLPDDLEAHVARVRAEGFPEYDVHPKGDRPVYSAIVYLEPFDWRNQRAFGFDMMSNPVRRAAMEHARDTGWPALSGKVTLVQETEVDRQAGFLLYAPLYRGGRGELPKTVDDRRERLRGFVYAPFRAADFMTDILSQEMRNVRLQVFDGTMTDSGSLLFDSLPGGAGEMPVAALGLMREGTVPLPHRRWTVRITALADARDEYRNDQPIIVAACGVIISALLFLITWSVARSSERLQSSEQQFRYLFEKNPSPMWVYDRETMEFIEVNEAALELYGYSRDEFLKLKATDIRPPEDRQRFAEFARALPEGFRRSGEWRHRTKSGRELRVDVNGHSVDYGGREASLVVIRDVTDRRRAEAALVESEQRFRSMANSMPALLWVSDLRELTFVNRSWSEFTGRPPERELGQGWIESVHPDDLPAIEAKAAELRRSPGPFSLEYRLRAADGSYRWFIGRGTPRFGPDGDLVGYIGVLFDITDLRTAQEQLQQAQKMESIGRLTGGIAHDFNNLLTVIEGSAEILSDDPASTDHQRKLAGMVVTAARRGAELTRSMLAFARRQPLEPKVIDLNQVVAGMETMLQRILGEDIDIRFLKGGGLWPAVVDAGQLETALLNLAVNARDAMPAGGRLTIETANATLDADYAQHNAEVRPGEYVMIAVSDSGTGMTPEVLERIFDPYFTTKPVGKGTGLGLSMVFGFAKQSGGHIKAYSEIGQGTTMRLYLPRSAPALGGARPPHTAAAAAPSGSETVLVVEDDPLVRAHVGGQLRGLGYGVIEVADGAAALAALSDEPHVDLLLTDMIMPGGMNGRDLAERARRQRPGLRILFMSGYAQNALTHRDQLDSGEHLLNKPFRRHELAAKVRKALDS